MLLSAGIIGSVTGCLGLSETNELSGVTGPESFVRRDGNQFTVDGVPVAYNGVQVGISTQGVPFLHDGSDWIDQAFEFLSTRNVSAVRMWGFQANFWEPKTHPEPGSFNDPWFEEYFDYAIAKARQQGIRLIVPLIQGVHSHSDSPPSTAAYADWSETADDRADFFSDEQANQYYKNYIEHVLTREHSITGVEYREDPTMMMWECGNEAGYHDEGYRGQSLASWYDGTASFIKSIDDTHLVGTGMHGSMGEVYEDWTWRNEYVDEHRSDAIDACSFHAYPARILGNGEPQMRDLDRFGEYINHKVKLVHNELNKPAYMGEIGTHYRPEQGLTMQTRQRYFRKAGEVANQVGLDGVHFWRLVHFGDDDYEARQNGEGKVTQVSIEDE